MSEVEKFYETLRAKWFPQSVPYHQLHPVQQHQLVAGINMILKVMDESSN